MLKLKLRGCLVIMISAANGPIWCNYEINFVK